MSLFDGSGSQAGAAALTLEAVQRTCVDCGFVKAGVAADKPLVLRADMPAFFKAQGFNSLSAFKAAFTEEKMTPPVPGQAPPPPKAIAPAVR
jgi:hypothetical protein